jgi:threonine synthase
MYVTDLQCAHCGETLPAGRLWNLCGCGRPLLVRYDLAEVRKAVEPDDLAARPATMWRYRELLPLPEDAEPATLGEGMTPILELPALGRVLGCERLLVKDEGLCPTGTFKARGAATGVSMAKALGVEHIAMPTAGNAGGAWAAYCARAGLELTVVMPEDAPTLTMHECLAYGAHTYLVRGLISDAGRIVGRAVQRHGWFDASTLKEPYRIEGKKTMGLEICEQLGWRVPDVIIYPTGGGVGLIGIWKAVAELQSLGWINGCWPRLVSVQAEGCAPIVRAFAAGARVSEFWVGAETIAAGLRVPKALGDFLVLDAIRATEGCAVAVSDAEIEHCRELAARAGLYVSPEGAAGLAAVPALTARGWLGRDDEVLVLNTGSGLKYPPEGRPPLTVLDPDASL